MYEMIFLMWWEEFRRDEDSGQRKGVQVGGGVEFCVVGVGSGGVGVGCVFEIGW